MISGFILEGKVYGYSNYSFFIKVTWSMFTLRSPLSLPKSSGSLILLHLGSNFLHSEKWYLQPKRLTSVIRRKNKTWFMCFSDRRTSNTVLNANLMYFPEVIWVRAMFSVRALTCSGLRHMKKSSGVSRTLPQLSFATSSVRPSSGDHVKMWTAERAVSLAQVSSLLDTFNGRITVLEQHS